MKIVVTEKAKDKKFDKKKLKQYWKNVYPKEYVDVLVSKDMSDSKVSEETS